MSRIHFRRRTTHLGRVDPPMDMSRGAAPSSSNPAPARRRRLILDMDDDDELPSPVHLAAQQPPPIMEMAAPTAAAVSSNKSKPTVIDLEELPSPISPPANSSRLMFITPRTVDTIFEDFCSRRNALVRALTTDQEEFFGLFEPGERPLLLYAHANGNWEVTQPEEEAPAHLPEPAMALNFVRDEMPRFDWLSRVAVRADSWLAGLTHYFGCNLGHDLRSQVFDMIMDLPTVYETFVQFYEHDSVLPANMPPSPDFMQNVYKQNNSLMGSSEENVTLSLDMVQHVSSPNRDSSTPAEENVPLSPGLMQNVYNPNNDSRTHDEDNDEEMEEVSDRTFCAACGAPYHANGFWICCDICDRWFHGKCVKIKASEAEHIYQYKCPDCTREDIGE